MTIHLCPHILHNPAQSSTKEELQAYYYQKIAENYTQFLQTLEASNSQIQQKSIAAQRQVQQNAVVMAQLHAQKEAFFSWQKTQAIYFQAQQNALFLQQQLTKRTHNTPFQFPQAETFMQAPPFVSEPVQIHPQAYPQLLNSTSQKAFTMSPQNQYPPQKPQKKPEQESSIEEDLQALGRLEPPDLFKRFCT